jgi:hypothetical protein
MKDSLVQSMPQAAYVRHELCSEICDTCFKNSGCIYDQYLFPAILNSETSQLQSGMNTAAQQAVKQHKIISKAAAA